MTIFKARMAIILAYQNASSSKTSKLSQRNQLDRYSIVTSRDVVLSFVRIVDKRKKRHTKKFNWSTDVYHCQLRQAKLARVDRFATMSHVDN